MIQTVKSMSNKIDITNFKGDADDLARYINENVESEDDIPVRVRKDLVEGMPAFYELIGKLVVHDYKVVRAQDTIWLYHEEGSMSDVSGFQRKAGYCLHIIKKIKRKVL